MNIKNLALITGLTVSGIAMSGALTPANAAIFNVGGTSYDITTLTGSFNANSALLGSQPFFGSQASAVNFATVVGNFFGQVNNIPPSGLNPSGPSGPLFAYAPGVATARFDIAPIGTVVTQVLSPTNTSRVYALATRVAVAVPENSSVVAIAAAVGLSLGLRSRLVNNKTKKA